MFFVRVCGPENTSNNNKKETEKQSKSKQRESQRKLHKQKLLGRDARSPENSITRAPLAPGAYYTRLQMYFPSADFFEKTTKGKAFATTAKEA